MNNKPYQFNNQQVQQTKKPPEVMFDKCMQEVTTKIQSFGVVW
jgi:hypothetical protein